MECFTVYLGALTSTWEAGEYNVIPNLLINCWLIDELYPSLYIKNVHKKST